MDLSNLFAPKTKVYMADPGVNPLDMEIDRKGSNSNRGAYIWLVGGLIALGVLCSGAAYLILKPKGAAAETIPTVITATATPTWTTSPTGSQQPTGTPTQTPTATMTGTPEATQTPLIEQIEKEVTRIVPVNQYIDRPVYQTVVVPWVITQIVVQTVVHTVMVTPTYTPTPTATMTLIYTDTPTMTPTETPTHTPTPTNGG